MIVLLAVGFMSGGKQSCCWCRDQIKICSDGLPLGLWVATGQAGQRCLVDTVCFPML